MTDLKKTDSKVWQAIEEELQRQNNNIELIAPIKNHTAIFEINKEFTLFSTTTGIA